MGAWGEPTRIVRMLRSGTIVQQAVSLSRGSGQAVVGCFCSPCLWRQARQKGNGLLNVEERNRSEIMNNGRVSRMTVLVALIAAAFMVGPPSAIFADMDVNPVGLASAVDVNRQFKLGVVDMTVSTLNPNTYTMVAEGMIIFPLYSYLIQRDADGDKVIGDLAYDWYVSPDGLTWEFDLVDTAYFLDPRNPTVRGEQVTSEDVIWSFQTISTSSSSRLNTWPEGMISRLWADDPFHFGITISEPFVPMQDQLMGTPILPKYYWEGENFITFDNDPPIGSGPFYYATSGLPDDGVARLARNPFWYGEARYGWQLHVDEFLMIRQEDAGTCWTALTEEESIDAMIGVDPGVYVKDLPSETDIVGFHQSNGFVYEFNLNQLTDDNRKLFGGSLNAGENNQLLLNTSIKTAISMAVNRTDLIDDALYGYGEWTTTLVPSQNPMSHSYGQNDHDCIGSGVPDPFDRELAREVLWDAGWRYDAAQRYYDKNNPTDWDDFIEVCPLYNSSVVLEREVLEFDFITLDTADTWQIMANKIVGWCEDVGVKLTLDLKSVNEMNTAWYAADYDVWLWDWVFGPYNEAASGVLEVLTTEAIGTDSDIYLSDPTFDALYAQAIREMDFDKRKELLYDMQDIIYLNRGCQALAFREDLYAFATRDWTNFGDLNTKYYLLPDVWPTWLCMRMEPVENAAPRINGVTVHIDTVSGEAEVGEPVSFTATASDDGFPLTVLNYTWIWGFGGEKEETGTDPTAEHIFESDGVYTVTLVVAETTASNGFHDYYSSYYTVDVTVYDMGNSAPRDVSFTLAPVDPDTGTVVTLKGTAMDDDGDELYYSWDFGDGSVADGQNVTHQFEEVGSWTVTLYVDDHRFGSGTRPAEHSELVAVGPNHVPSISVPDFGSVQVKQSQTYTVTASDSDTRDTLRYTWDWGDGTVSVTSTPSTSHTYSWRGTYTVRVFVDDLTGLDGHNVSDTGIVYVVNPSNKAPTIYDFEVSNDMPYVGQTVKFYANASDREGDPMTFTFDFGDGSPDEVVAFGGTGEDEIVNCVVEKEYTGPGSFEAYVQVSDGVLTTTSDPGIGMTVQENNEPVIEAFDPEPYGDTGLPITFAVTAYDTDGDDLTYTWVWDDGDIDQTTTDSATHTYTESGTYSVLVVADDGKGLEDSRLADVTVNWIPWVNPLNPRSIVRDVPVTFSVTAGDNDTEDALTIMWDFGDGTDYEYGSSVVHTYTVEGPYTRTVYVWDEFLEFRDSHNVSRSASVTVLAPGTNYPPEVEDPPEIFATEGEEVMFTVSATDPNEDPLTYTWDFGDSTGSVTGPPPVYHTYADSGIYTYTVWVDDGSGIPENNVSVEGTANIADDMPPVADAGGDRTVDEDDIIEFTGAASTDDIEIVEYAWTVDDYDGVHTYDTMEMQHVFDMPGTYTVELVVEDNIGQQSDPDTISVTVRDVTSPTANAGPDQTVAIDATVTFDAASSSDNVAVVSYEWSFVDGTIQTLTGVSPSYTFDTMGVYTVTLTVEDAAGNSDTDTIEVTVTDLEDPVANAGPDQIVDEGDTVTFAGSGTDNIGVVSYEWTFDYDGVTQTLSGTAPTFTFEIPDVYVVTLTVADEVGNTGTDTVTITVEALPNASPVADAGTDQLVTVGASVTLDGSGSADADGTIVNWTWSFTYAGDARELFGETVSFDFDIVGTYTVTLTVTDDDDATDTDTMVVTVEDAAPTSDPPVANAGTDQTVTVGEEVSFNGAGSSDDVAVVNYTWTFTYDGDPVTLYGVSPDFTFEVEGTYTVTLTVADAEGQTDSDTVVVTVEAEEDGTDDDDKKSFLESYGLPLGIVIALIVAALVLFFVMKGRKGGKSGEQQLDGLSAGEPEVPEDQS
jgi:PKD repeat protein/ABC-type transport system substrate-binding protein